MSVGSSSLEDLKAVRLRDPFTVPSEFIHALSGLLAGLDEFPTLANVSTASNTELTKIPYELLSGLFSAPLRPYSKDRKNDASVLHIDKIKLAGDVVHVFSHIKKTYRVQWVVLQGGSCTPTLRVKDTVDPPKRGKRKVVESVINGRWVPIDEVANAKYVNWSLPVNSH